MFKKNGGLDRRFKTNNKGFDASSRYQWKIIFIVIGLGILISQLDSCGIIDLEPTEEMGKDWDGTWDGHNVRP